MGAIVVYDPLGSRSDQQKYCSMSFNCAAILSLTSKSLWDLQNFLQGRVWKSSPNVDKFGLRLKAGISNFKPSLGPFRISLQFTLMKSNKSYFNTTATLSIFFIFFLTVTMLLQTLALLRLTNGNIRCKYCMHIRAIKKYFLSAFFLHPVIF